MKLGQKIRTKARKAGLKVSVTITEGLCTVKLVKGLEAVWQEFCKTVLPHQPSQTKVTKGSWEFHPDLSLQAPVKVSKEIKAVKKAGKKIKEDIKEIETTLALLGDSSKAKKNSKAPVKAVEQVQAEKKSSKKLSVTPQVLAQEVIKAEDKVSARVKSAKNPTQAPAKKMVMA